MPGSTRSSPAPDADEHLWITVLAGGIGSRFWPVSTPERPKQLLPLAGDRPLVVETVERARTLVPDERIRILTGEEMAAPIRRVLPSLGPESILLEPRARGTAPVLAWAAWTIHRHDPDAVLVSLHADHLVRPLDAFRRTVEAAAGIARREACLMTIAVPPDRPETGYGYVEPGEPIDAPEGVRASRVRTFHEKPDAATAARYVDEGYLWNTGIFVWPAATFLEEIREHAPEIAREMDRLERGDVAGFFDAVPSVAVDRAVMERSGGVGAVEALFEWDDVGAWHALHRTREADEAGNVVVGDGVVRDGRGNVVWAEEGRVVLWGVDDLVAVRSGETVLVTRRDRSAALKELLDGLPPRDVPPSEDGG